MTDVPASSRVSTSGSGPPPEEAHCGADGPLGAGEGVAAGPSTTTVALQRRTAVVQGATSCRHTGSVAASSRTVPPDAARSSARV